MADAGKCAYADKNAVATGVAATLDWRWRYAEPGVIGAGRTSARSTTRSFVPSPQPDPAITVDGAESTSNRSVFGGFPRDLPRPRAVTPDGHGAFTLVLNRQRWLGTAAQDQAPPIRVHRLRIADTNKLNPAGVYRSR